MPKNPEIGVLKWLEYDPADFAPAGWKVATKTPFRMAMSADLGVGEAAPVAPIDDLLPAQVADALEQLLRLAVGKGCAFELDYNEPLWPGLDTALERTCLYLRKREALMICTPETFHPTANTSIEVRFLDPSDPRGEFEAFEWVQAVEHEARPQKMEQGKLEHFRDEIGTRGSCQAVLARLHGQPVGTGYSWCNAGRCEITRIHTRPAARRKGVASTVTTLLLERAFERCGDLVWLTPSGMPAQNLYEKVGFRSIGYRRFYAPREPDRGRDT